VLFLRQFRTGGDRNFGYLVADEAAREAALIDPSYAPKSLVQFAEDSGFVVAYVFNTHAHFDHANGNNVVERLTGKKALVFGSTDPDTGMRVVHGARFPLGDLEIRVIHTPGHSADSICLLVGDALFTGDTLFVGKVGGTDLGPGARAEYDSIHQKLLALPNDTRVFPGHDVGVAPESTIGRERESNPFLTQPDFGAFVHLKRNWAAYKKKHGIA
jgi:glyoxylase-like metal-dependent hydrolase (beta-lactamase superfamily II)